MVLNLVLCQRKCPASMPFGTGLICVGTCGNCSVDDVQLAKVTEAQRCQKDLEISEVQRHPAGDFTMELVRIKKIAMTKNSYKDQDGEKTCQNHPNLWCHVASQLMRNPSHCGHGLGTIPI